MARIFVSFFNNIEDKNNPQAMPCFYEGFLQELVKNGNDVLCYSNKKWGEDFGKPPKSFLDKIGEFNPDLIILFNNCCYNLAPYFDCPIIIWEADSYLYYSNKEIIKNNPNRFKFVVSQSCEEKDIVNYFGLEEKNVFYLPFSTAVQAEDVSQKENISFIGTNYPSSRIINKFAQSSFSEKEKSIFKNVLDEIKKNPFLNENEFVDKLKIKNKKIKKFIKINDLINDLSSIERIQILSQIADLGLNLYGPFDWTRIEHEPNLILSYKQKIIYSIKHNQDIYNHSKIGININHLQAKSGFSWRVCDVMASNACLLMQKSYDFENLFPDLKIPTFNNKYEAREMCLKLLKDDNYRKEITRKSQELINKNFRFIHRLNDLEQILSLKLIKNKKEGSLKLITDCKYICKRKIKNNKLLTKMITVKYASLLFLSQVPILNKAVLNSQEISKRIKIIADKGNLNNY